MVEPKIFFNALNQATTMSEFFNLIGLSSKYHSRGVERLNKIYNCDIKFQINQNKLKYNPEHKKIYKCKECGKEFTEKYSKYSSGDFCCKSCACKYSQKHSNKNKKCHCIICGNEMEIDCRKAIKYAKCEECIEKQSKKHKQYNNLEQKALNYCLNCHKIIPKDQTYCSKDCHIQYRHKLKMKEVENNNGIGCHIRQIKTYLIETRGHKCEICGNTMWMNQPIPLILDHINGRASDDRLENLRLVCGNCDMQLPTYKSKNKHSDRIKRKGVWK